MKTESVAVEAFREAFENFCRIENAARESFPEASDEKIFAITAAAMNASLKIK